MIIKADPESILTSEIPQIIFEGAKVKYSSGIVKINFELSVRDYFSKNEFNWFSDQKIKNNLEIYLVKIKDSNIFNNINEENYDFYLKNKNLDFTKTKLANFLPYPKNLNKDYIETDLQSEKVYKFPVYIDSSIVEDDKEYMGYVLFCKINEEEYSKEANLPLDIVLEMYNKLIKIDKFLLYKSGILQTIKNGCSTVSINEQDFLWLNNETNPNKTITLKDLPLSMFNYDVLFYTNSKQVKKTYVNKSYKTDPQKNLISSYVSDLYAGIDDNNTVNGLFFIDTHKFIKDNSVILKILNLSEKEKEEIYEKNQGFSSLKVNKRRTNPQNKSYFLESNDKALISKKIDINLSSVFYENNKKINFFNFIDKNIDSSYLDGEYEYYYSFSIKDPYFSYISSMVRTANMLETLLINYYNSMVSISRNQRKYSKITNSFKDVTYFSKKQIEVIVSSYYNVITLFNLFNKKIDKKDLYPFLNTSLSSIEDIHSFVNSFSYVLAEIKKVVNFQSNNNVYEIAGAFPKKIDLSSNLNCIKYINTTVKNEPDLLPLIAPKFFLNYNFSNSKKNESIKIEFANLFKNKAEEILKEKNIVVYNEMLKNIYEKFDAYNTHFELLSQFYDIEKLKNKTEFIVSVEKYLNSLSEKQIKDLYIAFFGQKTSFPTTEVALNKIKDLYIKYNSSIRPISEKFNTLQGKVVYYYEDPYLSFLNAIYTNQVVKVQYLTNFEEDSEKNILLKSPVWKSLTQEEINNKDFKNKKLLCKISKINLEQSIDQAKNVDFDITLLNEYFTVVI